jgi:hypothetical protein
VSLFTERQAWLERNGWTDSGREDAGMLFFQVLEGTAAECREELMPKTGKR